jgi:hypothetical protein
MQMPLQMASATCCLTSVVIACVQERARQREEALKRSEVRL